MSAVQDHFNANGFKGYDDGQKMMDRIKAISSADAVSRVDVTNESENLDVEEVSANAVQGANLINKHDAVTVIRDEC